VLGVPRAGTTSILVKCQQIGLGKGKKGIKRGECSRPGTCVPGERPSATHADKQPKADHVRVTVMSWVEEWRWARRCSSQNPGPRPAVTPHGTRVFTNPTSRRLGGDRQLAQHTNRWCSCTGTSFGADSRPTPCKRGGAPSTTHPTLTAPSLTSPST